MVYSFRALSSFALVELEGGRGMTALEAACAAACTLAPVAADGAFNRLEETRSAKATASVWVLNTTPISREFPSSSLCSNPGLSPPSHRTHGAWFLHSS